MKRICVFGLGGIGGFMGAKLSTAAKELFFVARGRHLDVVKEKGLVYQAPDGSRSVIRPVLATSDPKEIGHVDLVVLCVKGYDLAASAEAVRPLLGKNTAVMPLLNGIDIYERVDAVLKTAMVLPSCIYISSAIKEPGLVTHFGGKGNIASGFDPKRRDFDPAPLISLMSATGVPFEWKDDPMPALWIKYLFIASFGLVTGMSGKPLGGVVENSELSGLVTGILREIEALAKAKGIILPADIVQASFEKGKGFPYETKTSFQRDLEVPGKPNEGDLFGGTILRLGAELGVPTPVTAKVFGEIKRKIDRS